MITGGSLFSDAIFKKILSIGYEFETHDIAKLSLHSNKKSLINSDITLRMLEDKVKKGSVTILKDEAQNYILSRIPIHKEKKGGDSAISTHTSASAKNHNDVKKSETEADAEDSDVDDSIIDDDDADEELLGEFMKEYEKEIALEKWENESFLEYFNENRKSDNKKTIKFQITNDVGDGDFAKLLGEHCDDLTIQKNDMYFFKKKNSKNGKEKIYDIKFAETLTKDCKTFTGVEYVITYYSPKKEQSNIIVATFADACGRIIEHLSDLKIFNGQLLIHNNTKTAYTPINKLDDANARRLYKKPGTNLFYIDTYDSKNKTKPKSFDMFEFIPQMTFRCSAKDALEIIKEIVKPNQRHILRNTTVKKSVMKKKLDKPLKYELNDILIVEELVDKLFAKYNESAEKKIALDTKEGMTLKTYVFFIYYKIFNYIHHHSVILSGEDYLKDYLTFASRHTNYDFYLRIKDILKTHYNINDVEEIRKLLYQPEALSSLYDDIEQSFEDIDEEGEYKYNDAFNINTVLEKSSANYGDPLYSVQSYFKYFEDPNDETENDWFIVSRIDAFSTTFELKNDDILLENRYFRHEVEYLFNLLLGSKISKGIITVKDMYHILHKMQMTNKKFSQTSLYNKKLASQTAKNTKNGSKKVSKKVSKSATRKKSPSIDNSPVL